MYKRIIKNKRQGYKGLKLQKNFQRTKVENPKIRIQKDLKIPKEKT